MAGQNHDPALLSLRKKPATSFKRSFDMVKGKICRLVGTLLTGHSYAVWLVASSTYDGQSLYVPTWKAREGPAECSNDDSQQNPI